MKFYKLFLIILSISISLFGQKDNYSSFADGNYIVDGLGVSKLEYERYKDNLDAESLNHNLGYLRPVRSSNRDNEFDIQIDFDDVDEAGCTWGGSVAPADRYSSVYGITFQDGANVIDECGNFGISGHSSPKFLSHYEGITPGDVNILFDEPVIRVQINAGKPVTITMTAYDENDNILDESSLQGSSELAPISVEADSIRKVVISGNGIYVLDDLMVQTQNLRGTFQGDYYSAEASETLIPFGFSAGAESDSYTVIDSDGTLETPLEFPLPESSADGDIIDFIIKSDWHTKRPKDIEIFYTAPNGEETVVASWTHPDKYDPEGGCSEDLDDFLENGSHIDCSLATPSYSIGFFNSEISLEQSDSLTMRILSAWSTSGINIYESWVISGDYCVEDCPGYGSSPEFGNFILSREDDLIAFDFDSDPVQGLSDDNFQVRWSGLIQADASGHYEFRTESDDGVRLYVADSLIIDAWIDQGTTSWSGSIYLEEGLHSLVLEYYENGGGANCYLFWTPPDEDESLVKPAGYDFSIDDFVESVFFDHQFVSPSWSVSSVINADDVDEIYNTEGTVNTRAVIGGMDLDQDGSRELIMTDYDGHRVIVFEYNMESNDFDEVWASPIIDYTNHFYNPRTVGTGDLDGDGKQEIVFPSSHGDNEGWHIYEWDGVIGSDNYGTSPSSVNSLEVDICCGEDGADFRGDHERTTIEDIDGDGKQELVIMIRRGSPRGTLITSVDGDIIHNGGGNETWVEEFFVDSEDYGGGSPYHSLPADLNGDGDYELVNHTWNNFNFYNITSTGPDQYEVAEMGSDGSHYQATENDMVSYFGGAAADIDGDANDEAYFVSYGGWGTGQGDLYVVDYDSDDDVLNINENHVKKIKSGDNFITENSMLLNSSAGVTISDVDGNGKLNILVAGGMITSVECNGDPGDSLSYSSENIYYHEYTEEITVTDSLGYISTSVWNNVAWASKVQSNFNGRPLDFDNDGRHEILVSFQGIPEFFTINYETYTSNGTWEVTTENVPNEFHAYVALMENETVQEINNIPVANDQSYTVDEDNDVAGSLSGSDVDEDELSYMVAQPPTHGEIIINEAVSNSYLSFDGDNDHVLIDMDWTSDSDNPRSIFAWINTPDNWQQGNVISWGTNLNNERWSLMVDDGGIGIIGQGNDVKFYGSVPTNTWVHVGATYDSDSLRLYVDGVKVWTEEISFNTASNFPIIIGSNVSGSEYFSGLIDNVIVVWAALNDSQVSMIYNGHDPRVDNESYWHSDSLGGYWNFNEASGDMVYDMSDNGNDGVITGATWETVEEEGVGFTYIPYTNFNGEDVFTYRAFDGMDFSSFATVTIEVTEVNDHPDALGDQHVGIEDDTLYAQLQGDDGDYFPTQMQMQSLTYSITSDVFHGDLVVDNGTGEFMYMPYDNFFGADSFYFAVTDNGTTSGVDDFLSDTAMVHLFVEPVNDAPVLSEFADTLMAEDSSLVLSIFASDVDNSDLSVSAYSSEEAVMVYVEDSLLYIYAEENWNGSAEIVVVANDNMSRATDLEQFMLTVTPVNDAPFFTMEEFTLSTDVTSGVDTWLEAEDIDSDIFFTLEGAPSWLMMDGSRMMGQPDQDSVYVFTLSVSDSEYVISEEFVLTIVDHRPHIISLTDVPQDQGRQMKIRWEPGHMDEAGYFTQFSIWRQVPTDSADLWDFITTVPWIGGEDDYSRVVPTLADSTADSLHYSTFRVTAHTEDVDFYHDSEPVEGYSIDNLHPTEPQGLMAVQSGLSVILQWLSAEDEDFSYHNVYRNDLDSSDPAMVFTTSDSFYVDLDMVDGSWEYWVTAVDSSGNESNASESVSLVLANEEEIAIPTVYALEQNYPNPFNPSTQIRYALPEQTMVTISIYDMMGRKVRTLVNQSMSPGYHTTLWNATGDKGLPVSAGMYIYTIHAGSYHHMKKMVLLK